MGGFLDVSDEGVDKSTKVSIDAKGEGQTPVAEETVTETVAAEEPKAEETVEN